MELGLGTEVQQQAHFELSSAKVVDQLSLVRGTQGAGRFHFDHDALVDEQIDAKAACDHTSKVHLDGRFFEDAEIPGTKLDCESTTVHGLEKPESELVVAAEERADDLAGQLSLE
jgi:hypothetical protein